MKTTSQLYESHEQTLGEPQINFRKTTNKLL